MAKKPAPQRVVLTGELCVHTAAEARERLLAAFSVADDIEVVLTDVTAIDTAGVQLMVATKREATVRDKTVSFTGHSQAVVATLDLCDLCAYFGDPVLIHSRA